MITAKELDRMEIYFNKLNKKGSDMTKYKVVNGTTGEITISNKKETNMNSIDLKVAVLLSAIAGVSKNETDLFKVKKFTGLATHIINELETCKDVQRTEGGELHFYMLVSKSFFKRLKAVFARRGSRRAALRYVNSVRALLHYSEDSIESRKLKATYRTADQVISSSKLSYGYFIRWTTH